MNPISHKITMDLISPGTVPVIHAVQGEYNTRSIQIALESGGIPWVIPSGTTITVQYYKFNQNGGSYDTLSDGTPACSYQENIITAMLDPHILSENGPVTVQLLLLQTDQILATFPFYLIVEGNIGNSFLTQENYIHWMQWLTQELDAYVDKIQVSGGSPGGTMTGSINMNGHSLSGLNAPTENDQAATKGYVDTAKAEAENYTNQQVNLVSQQMKRTAPPNLLDNSDFRNPVNQRGITTATTSGYCIDRWRFSRSGSTGALAVTDSGIIITKNDSGEYCGISQTPGNAEQLEGKALTFAVKCVDHEPIILNFFWGDNSVNGSFADDTVRIFCYSGSVYIRLRDSGTEVTIEWAALYEGTYTAETLPEYQPKGYGAELLECMRYYQRFTNASGNAIAYGYTVSAANARAIIPMSVPIRSVTPSIDGSPSFSMRGGGKSASFTSATPITSTGNIIRIDLIGSELPASESIVVYPNADFGISADL